MISSSSVFEHTGSKAAGKQEAVEPPPSAVREGKGLFVFVFPAQPSGSQSQSLLE
jgi:hypothetical protein